MCVCVCVGGMGGVGGVYLVHVIFTENKRPSDKKKKLNKKTDHFNIVRIAVWPTEDFPFEY